MEKSKKRRVTGIILVLLAVAITAGIVAVFIPPKVRVTEISVIGSNRFWPNDDDALSAIQTIFQIAKEGSDDYTQLLSDADALPSDNALYYSVVTIRMTVTGRSWWDGYIPDVLVDSYEDPNGILLVKTPSPKGCDIDRLIRKEYFDVQLYICTAGKTREDVAEMLRSIRLRIPYTNWIHPDGTVYSSCRKAKITIQ